MGGTLYLVEQGAVLVKRGERLVAEKEGKALAEVPLASVHRVVIEGYVQISTQALCLLLEKGVPTVFLDTRGRFKGCLEPLRSINAPLRLSQYSLAQDMEFSLVMAKGFVASKLSNQNRVLQKLGHRHPGLRGPAGEIKAIASGLDRKRGMGGVRGVEGAASSVYFKALGRVFGLVGFVRTRRPPRDPVNSMLSYGYSILSSECTSALATHGLDPHIGFYHGIKHGRPALALDLMEEFRHPFVDMVALTLAERRMVDLENGFYYTEDGGCFMTPDTRKRFIAHYEKRARRFRPAIRRQAERLIKTIKGEEVYKPFFMG